MALSPAELERITKLAEECAEVIQVVAKIIRFGFESSSPIPHPLGQENNRILLAKEVADVQICISMLLQNNDVDWKAIEINRKLKEKVIQNYLHHNKIENNAE